MSIEDFISWANQRNELHVVRVARAYQTEQERNLFKLERDKLQEQLKAGQKWQTLNTITRYAMIGIIIFYTVSFLYSCFYRSDVDTTLNQLDRLPRYYQSGVENSLRQSPY